MVSRIFLILSVFFSLLSLSANAITRVTTSVDRNPVMVNESFVVTVEADAQVSNSLLDFSVLEKDFIIASSNVGSRRQIINQTVSSATTWTIVLIASKPGKYVIPAFTLKGVSSTPVSVEVVQPSNQDPSKVKEVYVETEVDSDTVYLQSSLKFTVKLFLSVEMQSGILTEPKMENANIQMIGKSEESTEIINGVRHRVVKRVYAITPQRSGEYTIEAPMFSGDIVVSSRRSIFSGFNKTKPISALGNNIAITVKPIPDNYSGQWLPSQLVDLSEQWQPKDGPYIVGDPITRIVTLTAIGVSEEQMPDIDAQYPVAVKTYPDKSTLNSANRQGQLVSQRKDSIAIVPTRAGKITFPEVKIPWWNTRTNKMEFATLPEKTIDVSPPANAPVPVQTQTTQPQLPTNAVTTETQIKEVPVNSYLTWAFLGAWLTTLLLWAIHVRRIKSRSVTIAPTNTDSGVQATNGRSYWSQFEKACQIGNPQSANQAILKWGRARWPEKHFTSAGEVAQFLGAPEVIKAMDEMQAALYGANGANQNWSGAELFKAFNAHKKPQQTSQAKTLAPLHP